MLNDKQTGLANYELKEVPKELGDYLCIYQCSRTHFVHINSLENVKFELELKYGPQIPFFEVFPGVFEFEFKYGTRIPCWKFVQGKCPS